MKKMFYRYWGLFCILVAWIIFSSPFIIKGLLPFPTKYLVTNFAPWSTTYAMPVKSGSMPDVITQIYPWKHITIESFKRGQIPLWNPLSFSGTVHAANYQTAVFSPINILYFIFSSPTAWSISILLQPLLAGFFMYLFLKSETLSKEACIIGSVSFMFCGFLVTWMAYGTLGFAALVLPLCFYAVNMALNDKKWWAYPLVSLAVWFSLVSGHFQTSLYVLIATTIYALYSGCAKQKYKQILYIVLFIILGVLATSNQLFITYDAFKETVRSSSFIKGEIIPWMYVITLFAPDFYGNPVTRNDWFGHYAEWAGFIGVIPLFLGLFAIKAKEKNKSFFGLLAGTSLLLATPTILTDLMYAAHIPVLSTSAASRIIILTSFSLSVLAAFGVDALAVIWGKAKKKDVWFFAIFGVMFLVIVWGVLLIFRPLSPDKLSIAMRNTVLPSVFLITLISMTVVGAYIHKSKRRLILCVLIGISMVDLLRFASKWMPFEPKEFLYPQMPVTKKLDELGVNAPLRVVGNYGNELGGMYNISSLEGYDAMHKRRYGEFISYLSNGQLNIPSRSVAILDKHGPHTQDALELLGVSYYLHKFSDGRFSWAYPFWEYPQYQSIWKDETYEIFENAKAYPRAFLASKYKIATEKPEILDTMFSKDTDRRTTVVLESKPIIEPLEGNGEAIIISYMPERIVINTKSDVPKLLFLSDSYDTGWKASIDGLSTPIYRANYTFRAVALSHGEHIVEFYYAPDSLKWGYGFAFLSLVGIILGSFYIRKYENRLL
ncbi:MAG: YfhO family protein [Patescibacteria group bacterium]